MEQMTEHIHLSKYIDPTLIEHFKNTARKPLTHEFQVWEVLPEALQRYTMECAMIDRVNQMCEKIETLIQTHLKPELPSQSETVEQHP